MNTILPFPSSLTAFARALPVVVTLSVVCATARADSATEGLTEADILTTVRVNQAVVRQRCWEPRKSTIGTTSVRTAIRITPDGTVDAVEASGDSDAMVDCVSRQVHTWRFPASKRPSTIQVPFKFVVQR